MSRDRRENGDAPTFIETQFPVSKLSKESYKERKSNASQTLTGLGKWWGRKPLVLVRAVILGLLLPASADPKRDREIFLKLMTMDAEGLWLRKSKSIPLREVYARLEPEERERWFAADADPERPRYTRGVSRADKELLQRRIFATLNYDDKLEYCERPENVAGPSEAAWNEINAHLGTEAVSLPQLVAALGRRRFGHVPSVGDAFCGGGSVPFEAARLGCDAYGSDLNPVAALLTWGALNIIGGGKEVAERVRKAQEEVYAAVDRQITEWRIEHNEQGHRADAYLYCTETRCPECGWLVPMAPSWVVGERSKTVGILAPDEERRRYDIQIKEDASAERIAVARHGTVRDGRLYCPQCGPGASGTPITALRGDRRGAGGAEYGLRLWENDDVVPRLNDVFQERLYCIRWTYKITNTEGNEELRRCFSAPNDADLDRERNVLRLLGERFHNWQAKGHIPRRRIEPGDETTRLMRERGWTHWHHLFTPRQLLMLGLILECAADLTLGTEAHANVLLSVGRCADWNSKLCRWGTGAHRESIAQTFFNQALNTLSDFAGKALPLLAGNWFADIESCKLSGKRHVFPGDVRTITQQSDIWVTDPPYADAINYHELSDFFLAWYDKSLLRLFPDWYSDSKHAFAVRGGGDNFRSSMVECYRNLTANMPSSGFQVVMFTHQDANIWADLALILWASGLRVSAAWTIATEAEAGYREGNYVQGTVLMVLRKQNSDEVAFLDEVAHEVESEVEAQLKSMLALEDEEDPNFADSDYQLAAYAAALRVLTRYRSIQDLDVAKELARTRKPGDRSPLEPLIEDAVRTASNYLIPKGIPPHFWKRLAAEEKFYLKGLDVERHGDFRSGVYQEFARGFGVREYRAMLASTHANQTRLKTASEFLRRDLGGESFAGTLTRSLLFSVYRVAETGEAREGLKWLRDEVGNYWDQREAIVAMLRFLGTLHTPHWSQDAEAARLLAGIVDNDHV